MAKSILYIRAFFAALEVVGFVGLVKFHKDGIEIMKLDPFIVQLIFLFIIAISTFSLMGLFWGNIIGHFYTKTNKFGKLYYEISNVLRDINSNYQIHSTDFLIRLKELENTLTKLGITTPQKFQDTPEVKDIKWKNWIKFLTIMKEKSGNKDFKGAKNWMKEYSIKK